MTRSARIFGSLALALALGVVACSAPAPRPAPPARPASLAPRVPAPPASNDAEPRYQAALALLKNGQKQPAQLALLALTRDFPDLSGPWTTLGIVYAQGRLREPAIASFTRAVAANPRNAVAFNWLGSLYREAGDFAAAEQAYRKALAVRPDYAAAHLNLGILYDVSLRRPQQALAHYRSYQQLGGGDKLIVSAWIKELEGAAPAAVSVAGAQP